MCVLWNQFQPGMGPRPTVCPALEAGSLPLAPPDLLFSAVHPGTTGRFIVMDSLNCPHTCVAKILKSSQASNSAGVRSLPCLLNLGLKILQVLRALSATQKTLVSSPELTGKPNHV